MSRRDAPADKRPAPKLSDDPLWYKDAVIYQLHIKSFFDANNDGIGDFAGLHAKLDYIVDLGVDAVWLLPFYPSPRRDDGYDIAEYRDVHPDYGSFAEAKRFIAAAHARGLRVITELVVNHTSDQHPWFQRAREAKKGSAARNYYVWSDTDTSYAGTRIIFCDTEKSNWTWDPVAQAYFWHRFYSHQPDLNFDNPQVLKEILGVMRFWLDAGVDGLRLDAVPYLVEREGTSNENLPQTHDILKKIRAAVDKQYPGRMLLAEANMWPEDVQQYFGGDGSGRDSVGDECHMAFHFPLMPRMYMAIAREDRHPITDIMKQTPDIPANCQWAIFLRNHDELTLEMVTSKERDYLWETYASERRARINLGIRRRLAPLMERDRRRVELMNSLLFSMPGTPVLYYGDEIGMGDNIHLGDRDGVRTPMQWSPDRNGGFSRADPEQLVLPPIMSAMYGYEAINVESQSRDPHSLLNWTRRMLALRRQHRAFGRGTLRFLQPGNRKILAYLRECGDGDACDDDVILCVANLSRAPQAVELDLSAFEGRVPVELLGNTSFPAVGQLTYLLTLPPHGFYWFQLSTEAQPPDWHTIAPQQLPELITLVLHNKLGYELTASSRHVLQNEVLPNYVARRRWFAQKTQKIERVLISYAAPLPGADDVFISELVVEAGGPAASYQIPVGVLWEDEDTLPVLPQLLALARVRRGPQVGLLTDAFSLERFARGVVRALRDGTRMQAGEGHIEFRGEAGLDQAALDRGEVRWLSAEQTNSSLLIEGAAMLKLIRQVNPGIHPEAEMTRHLTRRGYANTAALLGEVVRFDAGDEPHTLMLLQSAIPNQGDGWSWALDALKRATDAATMVSDTGEEADDHELLSFATMAATLGRRLAELHAVLAMPDDDPAFSPERAGERDADAWADSASEEIGRAFELLASRREWPNATAESDARWLLEQRDRIVEVARGLAAQGRGALRTRIHGDFHLGQVLVSQSDVFLIDFEGEPAHTLAHRRRKTSPLRDAAGLLRSFDYAIATVRDAERDKSPGQRERREAVLQAFHDSAERAFLMAYREVAEQAPHPWVDAEQQQAMLDLFLLEKAAYEIRYEATNRPTWIGLPITGMADVAQRLLNEADTVETDAADDPTEEFQ